MSNNEKQLKQATQVAYLGCLEKGRRNLIDDGKKEPFSVKQLILASIDTEAIKQYMEADGLDIYETGLQRMIKYSDLSSQDKKIISELDDEELLWKIVDIHNTTNKNGFYGCVIETSKDNAVVAFRGSEGFHDYKGLIYDWVESDLRTLNNEGTIQTEETEKYAEELSKKNILDKYETIDVTGHSLGGNLASHFAVACASKEENKVLFDKIGKVYNFDGQGVSNEYIQKHEEAINKAVSKITHYKWSTIGSLLYDLPGVNQVFLKTREYYGQGGIKDKIFYNIVGNHDTRSLIFDKNGKAVRGEEGSLAKKLNKISLKLEQHPNLTHSIYSLAEATIGKMIYKKENGKVGLQLPGMDIPKLNEQLRAYKSDYSDVLTGFVDEMKNNTLNFNNRTTLAIEEPEMC